MPVSIARMKEILKEKQFEDFYKVFQEANKIYEIVNVFDVLDWITKGEIQPATEDESKAWKHIVSENVEKGEKE